MIPLSIILTGFAAIISQIVYMREFLVVFYGNELSVAFIMASWLVGSAIGSLFLGRCAEGIRSVRAAFAGCQLALGIVLPLNILLIRSVKLVIGVNPGEIIPFFPMVACAFAVLVPTCAIIGFMFALGCRLYEGDRPGAARVGRVYVFEAFGAIAGGILASFVLVRLFGSVMIMASVSLLLAASAAFLFYFSANSRVRLAGIACAIVIFTAGMLGISFGGWARFDKFSMAKQWKSLELIASKNSIYGNVAITKNGAQYSFFDNGLHLYAVPDKQNSEEAVNFAMLEHPEPKRVLLIGGGVGGLVAEILKHPVEEVDYVELDPLILRAAREYLPEAYYNGLADERVSIRFEDGRSVVKRSTRKYDVIIVNLGDPYTAQLNRFYTVEFFKEAKGALRKGGVLSFGLSSSESYMSAELRRFLGSIYATLTSEFADVRLIPGQTVYFIASDGTGLLTYSTDTLMERAAGRGLDLKYVREYYLTSRLSPDMVSFTEKSIMAPSGGAGAINSDLRPISYYYDMTFWAARFKGSLFTRIMNGMSAKRVLSGFFVSLFLIIAIGLSGVAKGGSLRRASVIAVLANGYSQMAFQIIILLCFQIIYGFMFYKIGAIITAFMAGLALGGSRGIRRILRSKDERNTLMALQAGLCFYSVAMLPIFRILATTHSAMGSWIGANIVFVILPLVSGFLGGYLFPVANKLFLRNKHDAASAGGSIYGLDLMGACAGALLVGTLLIPIAGIPATCFMTAAVNAAGLVLSALSKKEGSTNDS